MLSDIFVLNDTWNNKNLFCDVYSKTTIQRKSLVTREPDKFPCFAWQLPFTIEADMLFLCLLCVFAIPGKVGANFRGNFVPPQTNPKLVQGDIAVPETHLGERCTEDAFLADETSLWPNGFIPYRIETFEWEGKIEPIFTDDQISNITLAQGKIMAAVPCLKFMLVFYQKVPNSNI